MKLLILLVFSLFQITYSFSQQIKLIKDTSENKAVFVLYSNENPLDSIEVNNVDFEDIFFNRVHGRFYHFIYSKSNRLENEIKRDQVLLYQGDSIIITAFTSREESTLISITEPKIGGGNLFYSYKHNLEFKNIFKDSLRMIVEVKLTKETDTSIIKEEYTEGYNLVFDKNGKIFFNGYDTLNGSYDYCITKNDSVLGFKKIRIYEVFPSIKYDLYSIVNIEGNWYHYSKRSRILTSYVNENIPNNLNGVLSYPSSRNEGYDLLKEW